MSISMLDFHGKGQERKTSDPSEGSLSGQREKTERHLVINTGELLLQAHNKLSRKLLSMSG